jgi:hypothetical protein
MRYVTIIATLLLTLTIRARAADSETLSLSNIIQFTAPPEPWVVSAVSPRRDSVLYTLPGKGRMQIAAAPGHAPKNAEAEEATRGFLHDQLRSMRNQTATKDKNFQVIKPLEIEKDPRFFVIFRETFRKDGNEMDQVHYYRNLERHQFLVTVVGLSGAENLQTLRDAAEKVALSGALIPKGQKAPPLPVVNPQAVAKAAEAIESQTTEDHPKPAPAPSSNTDDVAAAQKELDSAIAACEANLAKDPTYKTAKSKADAAEAKLQSLREQNPPDRSAIAKASEEWLDLKRPVESMRQAALAKDQTVLDARKKLAEARAKK